MKQLQKLIIALLLSIFLIIPSTLAVFYYTQPMEDASYDLSMFPEDRQDWTDDKGWTVYTNVEGTVTELTDCGAGSYEGLAYPGQTFYYSRTMTEELDNPTIRIGVVNQTVSISSDR